MAQRLGVVPAEVTDLVSPYAGYRVAVDDEYDTNVGELVEDARDVEDADVGIVGIPFDAGCVAGPRGSRAGPEGVRDQLTHGTCYNPEIDVDISEGIDVVDYGDVDALQTDLEATHDRVERVLTAVTDSGVVPFSVGGDHSLTYPTAKAMMNAVDGPVGVINVDAHHDVRHSHGGERSAGTPFRRLLEDDADQLAGKNFVELGLSGWHNAKYYLDWVHDIGATVVTAREVHKSGVDEAASRAIEAATDGTEAVFVSFDIDVLDAGSASGTCAPSPGGLLPWQLLELVYQLGRHELVRGADLMEVAPPLDSTGATTAVGAAVVTQFIGARKAADAAR